MNERTVTPVEFDQRRAWLDEMLARRHLWPAQEQIVLTLAQELGVEVKFYRLALNEPGQGWQEVRGGQ